MGILDPKSRVLDVVLTNQGRQALANSNLRISHYSLSDATTFYQSDLLSGSSDVSTRLYSECATDLPQDVISLLSNDAGQIYRVRSTALTGSVSVYGGQLLSGTYTDASILSGSAFSSMAGTILSSSLENFHNNFLLGTVDHFFEEDEFRAAPNNLKFSINDKTIPPAEATAYVSTLESLFQDPLLSHLDNFSYLPPVNKPSDSNRKPTLLGEYTSLGGNIEFDFKDVMKELQDSRSSGQLRTVRFDPSPRNSNIHLQFFEQTFNGLIKLDVVDFGTYRNASGNTTRVLFVGKIFENDYNMDTFVRLFTITLE